LDYDGNRCLFPSYSAIHPSSMDYSARTLAEVRLTLVSGVGPRLRQNLIAAFGSAAAALAARESELVRVDGIGAKLAEKISAAPSEAAALAELTTAAERGIEVLTHGDEIYPAALREIHDPPGVLFFRGDWRPKDQLAVGMVGSRHATQYGLRHAERIAGELARAGVTVVSGLARGIDGAAHRGALAAGGRTIAVLAGGLNKIYPPEHVKLADEVAAQGCLVTEAPAGMVPLAGSFPQRNRIISGLSLGVLVVEADDRSGALITTRHAAEQGREVFALPGPVDSRLSRGCHQLLRDGAKLITCAEEILEELGPLVQPATLPDGGELRHVAELNLNEVEAAVLAHVRTEQTAIDSVVSASGLPAHQVLATVSVLELRGLVRRVSGQYLRRV
jgi:DNA processing protein